MGNFLWKILRNLPYYSLVIVVIAGAGYTGMISGIYSVILGTYTGISGFIGPNYANLLFGSVGIITVFTIINMFYERE